MVPPWGWEISSPSRDFKQSFRKGFNQFFKTFFKQVPKQAFEKHFEQVSENEMLSRQLEIFIEGYSGMILSFSVDRLEATVLRPAELITLEQG